VSRPTPLGRSLVALSAMELRLALRRGENLLVMLVIPVAVLLFFASVAIVPGIAGPPADFLLPGAMALAIIATSLVNLGIATAYERSYGVLKRLGGAPLPRGALVASKIAAVLAIEIVQVALLVVAAAAVLGWAPAADSTASPLVAVGLIGLGVVLGTLAFAGLGLLMAGTLRAEATLALANGLFLGFLMLGGIVLPLDHLPAPLAALGSILPANALADVFRVALGGAGDGTPDLSTAVVLLVAWGGGATILAARRFRWE
jgi:ABC-2 type transport system permease protein